MWIDYDETPCALVFDRDKRGPCMNSEFDMSSEALETDYQVALASLTRSLELAISLSRASDAEVGFKFERQMWAQILFTRTVVVSISLVTLCPQSKLNWYPIQWDLCSIATLSRNIFEIYINLEYFCFQDVGVDEWTARRSLMYLHDLTSRLAVSGQPPCNRSERLEENAEKFRIALTSNNYFQCLNENNKKKFLKGKHHMFLSQDEVLARTSSDVDGLRRIYNRLSNETHTLPMAFTQVMNNGTGLGTEVDHDKVIVSLAMQLAASCLSTASRKYVELLGCRSDFTKADPYPLENLRKNATINGKRIKGLSKWH